MGGVGRYQWGGWQQGAQCLLALGLWLPCQLPYGIIKPRPVAALAGVQGFEGGHQLVVRGLGRKAGVVGAGHPAVVARHLGGGGQRGGSILRCKPLRTELGVVGSKSFHCSCFYSNKG